MPKRRIDALLAERGLVGSRTSAAESVRAGRVRIGLKGHSLRPGYYRAALKATDGAGNRSKTKRIYFRVLRR